MPIRDAAGDARIAPPVAVVGLRLEHTTEPIGIDVDRPRFSWVIDAGDARDVEQSSYRIRVERADARTGASPVWDSGPVAESASFGVDYDGPRLAAATRYRWRVEVETTAGAARADSWFVSGLLTEEDWGGAAWIGRAAADSDGAPAPAPLLRTGFELDRAPASALLFFAAGGYADLRINGSPASDHVLAPGFTNYDRTVQYDAIDVTDLLDVGPNAIRAELGRGFYAMTGANVWEWHRPSWRAEPALRALLRLRFDDGSERDVVTDASWRTHDGPTRFDDLYAGERYDARARSRGSDARGFDDSDWDAALVVRGPRGRLVHQPQQPIRVIERLAAVEATNPRSGVWVLRFPRVIAGTAQVRATGPGGTEIELRYAEKLLPDGTVDQRNNGRFGAGFQTDRLVLSGSDDESWAARFSYKGFQFVEVSGWPDDAPPLDAVSALVLHSDTAVTGTFDSDDPTLNGIHRAVVATMLNNLHHIPTDTPMFEKNGWTGDAAVGVEMFLLNLDAHALFAKWMRDVDESRLADGSPMVIAPSSNEWGDWGVVPPWHLAYLEVPWQLYRYGGDRRVLHELYDGIAAYIDLEFGRSPGGIADSRLGDWMAPEADPQGGDPREDRRVSATATLFRMLTTASRIARVTGHDADAARFDDRAEKVRAAFDREFWSEAEGHYRGVDDNGYRQTHNLLALAYGIPSTDERVRRTAESIADDVRARGTHLNTGVLGTKHLLPVLTATGHADLAMAVATQTSYPSWGYQLAHGATTMWEHWSTESRSLGHYFLGTVEDWLFHDVVGIRPDEVDGWRNPVIAPAVTATGLGRAAGSVATPFGVISAAWTVDAGTLTLDVVVPVGISATVRLPAPGRVTESGVPLVPAPDSTLEVVVGSGRYSFRAEGSLD